ncbi:hypothetical protein EIJ81_00755 (plasmid) [Aliivibrio salmonicida]|uniref:PD-(D/E)XK nuclease-like domain-containing protein n=1 Tax=Aliivibrio salmonicida TaxID=40269 RepID=UPI000F6E3BE5|nr:PD-(D/E)XK nuclease-like domain-containing protein [Aliivibrio salmonicida]AZL83429.1 hypothetical protein EIJ81_00755 [Aliivibrio salmonicida]
MVSILNSELKIQLDTTSHLSMKLAECGVETWGSTVIDAYNSLGEKNFIDQNGQPIAGVYRNMSNADYHAIEAISSSILKEFAFDPSAAKETLLRKKNRLGNKEFSPVTMRAMAVGSLVHTLVLEPHKLRDEYEIEPSRLDYSSMTILEGNEELKGYIENNTLKKGASIKERKKIILQFNPFVIFWDDLISSMKRRVDKFQKTYITLDDYEKAQLLAKKILSSELGKQLFSNSENELSIIAYDYNCFEFVKCRYDAITKKKMAVDIKTIHTLSSKQIGRDMEERLYQIQGAFYQYVSHLIDFDIVFDEFAYLFCEWDNHQRFILIELDDVTWSESKTFMNEIYMDFLYWKNNLCFDDSLNKSQTAVIKLSNYSLRKRVRIQA